MSAKELWALRARRAEVGVKLAEVEARIVRAHTARAELLAIRAELEAKTLHELRAMSTPEVDVRLTFADQLADAYVEGLTAMKLGVLP